MRIIIFAMPWPAVATYIVANKNRPGTLRPLNAGRGKFFVIRFRR
jgi:hypothetical protein